MKPVSDSIFVRVASAIAVSMGELLGQSGRASVRVTSEGGMAGRNRAGCAAGIHCGRAVYTEF